MPWPLTDASSVPAIGAAAALVRGRLGAGLGSSASRSGAVALIRACDQSVRHDAHRPTVSPSASMVISTTAGPPSGPLHMIGAAIAHTPRSRAVLAPRILST